MGQANGIRLHTRSLTAHPTTPVWPVQATLPTLPPSFSYLLLRPLQVICSVGTSLPTLAPFVLHKKPRFRGAWVALSVKRGTSAQVMISRLVGSSPAMGSVLTAQSQEPASDCVSLSALPQLALSVSLSKIKTLKKKIRNLKK